MHAYDTSVIRMDGLEMCTFSINVSADVESGESRSEAISP